MTPVNTTIVQRLQLAQNQLAEFQEQVAMQEEDVRIDSTALEGIGENIKALLSFGILIPVYTYDPSGRM